MGCRPLDLCNDLQLKNKFKKCPTDDRTKQRFKINYCAIFRHEVVRSPTLLSGGGECLLDLCVEVDGDDQAVETQDLGEDEDQDHTDEETRLLGRASDSRISHDADGEPGR